MRVVKEQLDFIKNEIKKSAPEAKIYLFGSRLDDQKRGGDIDIMILTNKSMNLDQKLEIKIKFYEQFGEQKIDLVNFTFDAQDNFKDLILLEAKEV